jgi:hypothetical protein
MPAGIETASTLEPSGKASQFPAEPQAPLPDAVHVESGRTVMSAVVVAVLLVSV